MMATLLAGVAEFERELMGASAWRRRRQVGHLPKSDRLTPKVLALVAQEETCDGP